MSPNDIAERHRDDLLRTARTVEAEGVRLWRQVDPDALSGSWAPHLPPLAQALTAAQLSAASRADGYTDSVLREQGIDAQPEGEVNPRAFAGQAADGRPLPTLLLSPVVTAKRRIDRGEPIPRALASGQAALRLLLRTEVADAGRVADGVAVASRPTVAYVRHVTPPSCPRCAILAGRAYRYSQGFQRHPGCDCLMLPSSGSELREQRIDPMEMFRRGEIRGLSKADARAIREGADINQVVNAHRGMYTAGGRKLTREGTTRRGLASKRMRAIDPDTPEERIRLGRSQGFIAEVSERRVTRLRPEQIYREASSRDEAIAMLRLNGYIR